MSGRAAMCPGAEWPQWGGNDNCNMVSSEKNLPETFQPGRKNPDGSGIDPATTENVKWTARLGSQTYGNPTVCDGKVFLGTNDHGLRDPRLKSTSGGLVKCFSEASGELLWQLACPRRYLQFPGALFDHLNLGICSSPTVDVDRVYVVTNRAEVLCLDVNGMADGNEGPFTDEGRYLADSDKTPGDKTPGKTTPGKTLPTDGDIVWLYDIVSELPVGPQDTSCCSVLIDGDFIYVGTSNGVDKSHDKVPFPQGPSLIVLDKRNGRLLAVDNEKIGTRLFHGQWSSPSLGEVNGKKLVFYGAGDGICYGFEALREMPPAGETVTLTKVWSCDCLPREYRFRDGKPIPYRSGDRRIAKRWGEYGNKNDGTFLGPSEIIATPVFDHNRVYVAVGQDPMHGRGKGMLTCIDATQHGDITEKGKLWTYDQIERSLSSVSVADGLLYVADVIGTVHCLDAESGKRYWVHETGEETWASALVADGKVYLGTKQHFWVFAAGRQKRIIGKMRLGAPVWCSAIVANNVLYVTSQRYLWAVQGD